MTRRSMVIATVLSMLLCAAIVQLWCAPDVRVVFLVREQQWEAYSQGGAVGLTNAPQVDLEGGQRQAAMMPHLFALAGMAGADEPSYETDRRRQRATLRILLASPRTQLKHYSAPYWLIALLLFMVTPMLIAATALRAGRFQRMGRCIGCGYNISMSRERCPECGKSIHSLARD